MEAARRVDAYVVALSTDYVFDGEKETPYDEWDTPNPLSVYGASKLAGEFEIDPSCAVVRTSWVCGQYGSNAVKTIVRLSQQRGKMRFVTDQKGSPTVVSDLVVALRSFVVDRLPGTWHVTNQGALTLVRVRPGGAHGGRRRSGPRRPDPHVGDEPAPRRDEAGQLPARQPGPPPRRAARCSPTTTTRSTAS